MNLSSYNRRAVGYNIDRSMASNVDDDVEKRGTSAGNVLALPLYTSCCNHLMFIAGN